MYNNLNFYEFFNDDRQNVLTDIEREIALSLITPNQVIHAEPITNNALCQYHLDLSLQIISDIYKIAKPTSTDRKLYYFSLLTEISKHIKNDERNFIIARYIISRTCRQAIVEFPYFITPKEYQEVINLCDIYNSLDVTTKAIIHRYDPITNEDLTGQFKTFDEDNLKNGLIKALNYLEENHCIMEYELKAPKEYILK